MTIRIPNLNARLANGKVVKRCMFCGAPADWHYPDGSACTLCAMKAGLLGK